MRRVDSEVAEWIKSERLEKQKERMSADEQVDNYGRQVRASE